MRAVSSEPSERAGQPLQLRSLPQGQHVLIVGMTGSGKTTLLERLMSLRPWGITLDTKRELTFAGWPIADRAPSAFGVRNSIVRPRTLDDVEYVFARAMDEGGWTVAVDEVYMITTQPGSASLMTYPPSYILGLTRGRSKKLTVVTGTQRPRFLPLFAMTEASHFFIFEPGSADDAKYLAKMAGIPGLDERALAQLRDHHFLYYSRPARRLVRSKISI